MRGVVKARKPAGQNWTCRAHAADENFPGANFDAGIRLNKALLDELARG